MCAFEKNGRRFPELSPAAKATRELSWYHLRLLTLWGVAYGAHWQ
jgi:hypothetical protein